MTRGPRPRLDEAAEGRLVRAYRAGVGTYALAERFGIHAHTVRAILKRHGVDAEDGRSRGPSDKEIADAIRAQYGRGDGSIQSVAGLVGASTVRVMEVKARLEAEGRLEGQDAEPEDFDGEVDAYTQAEAEALADLIAEETAYGDEWEQAELDAQYEWAHGWEEDWDG